MKFWFGIILCILGLACIICAIVWQQILCYQMFGCVFEKVFIPHWSAAPLVGLLQTELKGEIL